MIARLRHLEGIVERLLDQATFPLADEWDDARAALKEPELTPMQVIREAIADLEHAAGTLDPLAEERTPTGMLVREARSYLDAALSYLRGAELVGGEDT